MNISELKSKLIPLILCVLSITVLFLVDGKWENSNSFKNHDTLLVHKDNLDILAEYYPSILSSKNIEVGYNDFNREKNYSVDKLFSSLHPQDPRIDPFMLAVSELFSTESEYERVIVPGKKSLINLIIKSRKLPFYAELENFNYSSLILSAIFLIAATMAITLKFKTHRYLVLISLIPNFLILLKTGPVFLLPILGALFLLPEILNAKRSSQSRIISLVLFIITAFILHIETSYSVNWILYYLVLVANGALFYLLPDVEIQKESNKNILKAKKTFRKYDHKLFVPILLTENNIDRKKEVISIDKVASISSAAVIVIIVILTVFIENKISDNRVVFESNDSTVDFEDLSSSTSESFPLLSYRGWIAHRYYQQVLPYGHEWGFPQYGYNLTISSFEINNNILTERMDIIETYNDLWLESELENVALMNIGHFLRSESEFSGFSIIEKNNKFPFSNLSFRAIIILFISIWLILNELYIRTYSSRRGRNIGNRRRKAAA